MNLAKGVLGALLGGAIGAVLWIGIAYATGWELSILAIIVGGCAGFGMGMGNKGAGGMPAGVLAALVAVVCILGAKFGVAHLIAQQWMESESLAVTEDDARTALMETVYAQFSIDGVEMTESDEDDYPPEVWNEADRRWHAMSLTEREAYRAGLEQESRAGAEEAAGVLTILAFIFSFGLFDIVCFGLAISTAYKTASTRVTKDEIVVIDDVQQAPAMFRVAEVEAGSPPSPQPREPATAATPSHPPASSVKKEAPTTGLGIFSMLGQERSTPAHSILGDIPETPEMDEATTLINEAPPARQTPAEQPGLINLDLDLGDERAAA